MLENLGVAPDKTRERVVSTVGYATDKENRQRPLTPRARKVLEAALEEARRIGHDHVAGEHILLGLLRESKGVAGQVLYWLGANLDEVRREVAWATGDLKKAIAGGDRLVAGLPRATTVRARVEGLVVQARCGVTEEERATPQPLSLDLSYVYEAWEGDDLSNTVDYGAIIESVAGLLEREEFRLLETGARMVGERVLDEVSPVREITVVVTKLRVPIEREVSTASVEATFGR